MEYGCEIDVIQKACKHFFFFVKTMQKCMSENFRHLTLKPKKFSLFLQLHL